MKGHEEHLVRLLFLVHIVDVGQERDLLQKACQRGAGGAALRHALQRRRVLTVLLFGPLLIGHDLGDEFVDILQPLLGILFPGVAEVFFITRGLEDLLDQIFQTVLLCKAAQFVDQFRKGPQLFQSGCPQACRLCLKERRKQRDPPAGRIIRKAVDGGLADAPARHVDDAAQRQIILPVLDGLEIGQDVPDLPALIEVGPSDDVVGHRMVEELFLQESGLGIGAIEHRDVPVVEARRVTQLPVHVLRHEGRLLRRRGKAPIAKGLSLAPVGPEGFFLSILIVPDNGIGGVENVLRGAVILLEPDHRRVGIGFLKA